MLRSYQQNAENMLLDYFPHNEGNPVVQLPTGAGKSHCIASLCKRLLKQWPSTRILMLTHVKELIEQNAEKMRQHWPGAPMGIYSASVGKRELGEAITFAGIQSIIKKKEFLKPVDIVIVDECDLINTKDEGTYRELISHLKGINPHMRVIGYTATPYRLGQGMITEGENPIFTDILEPPGSSIKELVSAGYLAPLRSKQTESSMDFSACAVRGGDYANKEMNQLAQQSDNERLIDEVILKAGDRKAWLFFCSGVEHAQQVNDILNAKGIPSCCVTGKTPKKEREKIINQYKAGEYKALTNANVLTTGFDYPDIDLLVFLRPTLSARLYMQMAGRGMRLKSHTDHCLVMDFAGLIRKHGPVTDVKKPQQSKKGEAPIKVCEQCQEIVHLSAQFCPSCNFQFYEESQKPNYMLDDDNCIMGLDRLKTKAVSEWVWAEHVSKSSGNLMIKVSYYSGLSDRGVTEYFPVLNNSERGNKAVQAIYQIAEKSGANINCQDLKELANSLNDSKPPALIRYEKNGNLFNVILREWSNGKENNRNLGMASELSRATA